nr:uncharacterized protein LOC127303585 [Lolium perenne]
MLGRARLVKSGRAGCAATASAPTSSAYSSSRPNPLLAILQPPPLSLFFSPSSPPTPLSRPLARALCSSRSLLHTSARRACTSLRPAVRLRRAALLALPAARNASTLLVPFAERLCAPPSLTPGTLLRSFARALLLPELDAVTLLAPSPPPWLTSPRRQEPPRVRASTSLRRPSPFSATTRTPSTWPLLRASALYRRPAPPSPCLPLPALHRCPSRVRANATMFSQTRALLHPDAVVDMLPFSSSCPVLHRNG